MQFEKEFKVIDMCRVFEVSRSGYYQWQKRPVSNHDRTELEIIKPALRKMFKESRETYGCVRVSNMLCKIGVPISAKRASRIMKIEKLIPKAARRFKVTTDSSHKKTASPDLVNRNFTCTTKNTVWTSDFTAIETREGWLYLVAFLDISSRTIVGWEAAATMTESVLIRAFNYALLKRIPEPSMVVHSDKGGQYFGKLFRAILNMYGIRQSMGSTGRLL